MRNIPQVTKYLLIINIVMFLITMIVQPMGIDLTTILGLHFFKASHFHVYQLITYMFMHGGWMHIIMNMFMLWMFGMVIENVWGPKKFLFYYIVCGIGAGLCQELAQYGSYVINGLDAYQYVSMGGQPMPVDDYLNLMTTVGASGAIYAVLLAFGMLFPEERMFIIPIPIPIKAKWLVLGSVALELFYALGQPGDGVAHVAHLGGMLFGFVLIKYWQKHPYSGSGDFGMGKGSQFFDRMKNAWDRHSSHSSGTGKPKFHYRPNTENRRESDWDYNARKKAEQDEIDRILDKIRQSGYDSLTDEEKRKLFDQSKK